jgi:hypothetical protein
MLKSLWLMNSGMTPYSQDHVLSTIVEAFNPQFAPTGPDRKRFLDDTLRQIEVLSGVLSHTRRA